MLLAGYWPIGDDGFADNLSGHILFGIILGGIKFEFAKNISGHRNGPEYQVVSWRHQIPAASIGSVFTRTWIVRLCFRWVQAFPDVWKAPKFESAPQP
jgi:hypothetical protein